VGTFGKQLWGLSASVITAAKTAERTNTLAEARATHPHRFTRSQPPKILDLPEAAWINPPTPAPQAA